MSEECGHSSPIYDRKTQSWSCETCDSVWAMQSADTVQVSRADLRLLLSFAPEDCPEGLDPTFYHTLTYEGDRALQDRVDAVRGIAQEQE